MSQFRSLDCSSPRLSVNDKKKCTEVKVCNALNVSGSPLTDGEKKILEAVKTTYLQDIVGLSQSKDEVSALYELTHDVISRACENVDSLTIDSNYGRDHSYKICLSWVYFCSSSSVYSTGKNQIDQYLLKDTYRRSAESSLTGCTFLTTEPRWSDYWN